MKVLITYYKFGILFSAMLILAIEVGWIPSSGLPVRDIVYYMKLIPMTLVIAISFIPLVALLDFFRRMFQHIYDEYKFSSKSQKKWFLIAFVLVLLRKLLVYFG
ncbi:hypothetical protein [Fusibacter sp. JL216-2]|uniref:hypothetical protein n=1 Tax=Fusibacter sp. JL216-2 TaxID=3071453 RepID=UPI003D3452E9